MIIDGRKIAERILEDVSKRAKETDAVLSVIVVGNNPATESFVRIKKRKAEAVGIELREIRFEDAVTEKELISAVSTENEAGHAIVVQLPLPESIDKESVVNAIKPELDVDVLGIKSNELFEEGKSHIMPPVVGAIDEILKQENINPEGKNVVIVGNGALVGKPASVWFKKHKGAMVKVVDKDVSDISEFTKEADIIVSGAGVPNLITPEMLKEGVVLLDAGTSEDAGELKGDISPECEDKASLYTPVPGGIGPITVSVLLRNVVEEK